MGAAGEETGAPAFAGVPPPRTLAWGSAMTRDDDEGAEKNPLRPLDLDPERAARSVRAPYGIVDIGSNSVRLVVYDQLSRAPLPRFNEKLLCRLGENLAETGEINPESFGRTVNALRRFRAVADAMGVVKLDVTGTEAIRIAKNGAALAEAIRAEAGLQVRILSGAEEAHYSALGVISGFFRPIGVVGDMGGGSLEVAEALDDKVGDRWVSLPLGALPVEKMLADGVQSAKRAIDAMLKERLPPTLAQPVFYAVGGGWRTFAKAHMAATGAPVRVTHGYTIAASEARNYARTLMSLPAEKLKTTDGVSERRARTTPAAAILLDRVLKRLAPERVVFSALGLREGLLYSQLSRAEQYLDPLVEGAQLIGLPQARVPTFRARAGALDGRSVSRRNAGGEAAAGSGLGALGHRLAVAARYSRRRGVRARAALPFHRRRPRRARLPRRCDQRALCRPAGRALAFPRDQSSFAGADGAALRFLAARCCSPTASPAACRKFSTTRGFASKPIACA